MNYPKITIVTPSYNQGCFLEDTINSIINQNYPNLEYIICDGGSTDNSVEIIRKYQDRITWWCSEKDTGQSNAINKGMKRATGDIVAWINSDDVLLPGALFVVANFYISHPECVFLNGTGVDLNKDGQIRKFTHIIMSKFFLKNGCCNIVQQGMFWKRSLFEKIGYLNEDFHAMMDVEFLIRVYESDVKVMKINQPLGAIRVYEGTKTALGGYIWKRDTDAIHEMTGGKYSFSRTKRYFWLFAIIKCLRGCYFRNYIMLFRYGGTHFSHFSRKGL